MTHHTRYIRRENNLNFFGFTLVELLLVLIILSVITGLSVGNFSRTYDTLLLKKSVDDVAFLMRYAQSRAVTKGRRLALQFDPSSINYGLLQEAEHSSPSEPVFEKFSGRFSRTFSLPEKIQLQTDSSTVYFYPDGNMDKVRIVLSFKDQSWTISTKEQKNHVVVFQEKI